MSGLVSRGQYIYSLNGLNLKEGVLEKSKEYGTLSPMTLSNEKKLPQFSY